MGTAANMKANISTKARIILGATLVIIGGGAFALYKGVDVGGQPQVNNGPAAARVSNAGIPSMQQDDITKKSDLPDTSPIIQQNRQAEQEKIKQAETNLDTFISGDNHLAGFEEVEQVNAGPDFLKPMDQQQDLADQERKALNDAIKAAQDQEKTQEQVQERQTQNTQIQADMAKMRAEMERMRQELEGYQQFSQINMNNRESLTSVMNAIITEAGAVPSIEVTEVTRSILSQGGSAEQGYGDTNTDAYVGDGSNFPFPELLGGSGANALLDTDSGSDAAGKTGCEEQHLCRQVTPGSVNYGLLLSEINSDDQGPIIANLFSGPFAGGRVVGGFALNEASKTVSIQFTQLVYENRTYNIQAYAVNPSTLRVGMADDVDNHYFERYGMLMAASFLSEYRKVLVETETNEQEDGDDITTVSAITGDSDRLKYALGGTVEPLIPELQKNFNRKPTVSVYNSNSGKGEIGILFLSELEVPMNQ